MKSMTSELRSLVRVKKSRRSEQGLRSEADLDAVRYHGSVNELHYLSRS